MTAAPGVPLTVHLAGQRVVCVGAGPVAAGKLRPLLDAGADVILIAPEATDALARTAAQGRLAWHRRRYQPGDLAGAVLIVAATADPRTNARVAAEAADLPALCVRTDGGGTADITAAVHRGPLMFTVSTAGRAPALSRRLREELGARYGPEYGLLATLLGELRADPAVRATLAGVPARERRERWRAVLDTDILTMLRDGDAHSARKVAAACLSSSSD